MDTACHEIMVTSRARALSRTLEYHIYIRGCTDLFQEQDTNPEFQEGRVLCDPADRKSRSTVDFLHDAWVTCHDDMYMYMYMYQFMLKRTLLHTRHPNVRATSSPTTDTHRPHAVRHASGLQTIKVHGQRVCAVLKPLRSANNGCMRFLVLTATG